ncbi:MAG TPA: M48 family metallopeptidase, partial [Polyangia bacterium]|nr:M48 family metallopeptidase [Polyangia bacterium]
LDRVRPVTLAVEATVRLWQSVEKSRMLGTAVKVSGKQFPRIAKLAERCADTLRIPMPTLYVSPNIGSLNAHTFGTGDDPYIVLNAALVDHLSEPELLDVIGHECGHIQNNHVVYMTTLHFLTHAANMFLRWSVKPAVLALNGWARRAEITCDRAGLICTGDLDASIGCLVKLAIGSHKLYSEVKLDEYLAQLDEAQKGIGRFDELGRTHPYLPKRVAALRLFAETAYFQGLKGDKGLKGDPAAAPAGTSKQECDAKVAELLAVLK